MKRVLAFFVVFGIFGIITIPLAVVVIPMGLFLWGLATLFPEE